MKLFDVEKEPPSRADKLAADLIEHGNDTFEIVVNRYLDARHRLWNQPAFTLEDCQATLDAMGEHAVVAMAAMGELARVLSQIKPGALAEDELSPPVAYTVVAGKVLLDKRGKYPGPKVEEEEPDESPVDEERSRDPG